MGNNFDHKKHIPNDLKNKKESQHVDWSSMLEKRGAIGKSNTSEINKDDFQFKKNENEASTSKIMQKYSGKVNNADFNTKENMEDKKETPEFKVDSDDSNNPSDVVDDHKNESRGSLTNDFQEDKFDIGIPKEDSFPEEELYKDEHEMSGKNKFDEYEEKEDEPDVDLDEHIPDYGEEEGNVPYEPNNSEDLEKEDESEFDFGETEQPEFEEKDEADHDVELTDDQVSDGDDGDKNSDNPSGGNGGGSGGGMSNKKIALYGLVAFCILAVGVFSFKIVNSFFSNSSNDEVVQRSTGPVKKQVEEKENINPITRKKIEENNTDKKDTAEDLGKIKNVQGDKANSDIKVASKSQSESIEKDEQIDHKSQKGKISQPKEKIELKDTQKNNLNQENSLREDKIETSKQVNNLQKSVPVKKFSEKIGKVEGKIEKINKSVGNLKEEYASVSSKLTLMDKKIADLINEIKKQSSSEVDKKELNMVKQKLNKVQEEKEKVKGKYDWVRVLHKRQKKTIQELKSKLSAFKKGQNDVAKQKKEKKVEPQKKAFGGWNFVGISDNTIVLVNESGMEAKRLQVGEQFKGTKIKSIDVDNQIIKTTDGILKLKKNG